MTLGIARRAPVFALGFDALEELPRSALLEFRQKNFTWVGAYLEVLTPLYVDLIFSCDFAIRPICEARIDALSADVGRLSAALEVKRLRDLGCPVDVEATIDLEEAHGTAPDVTDFVNTFGAGFYTAGFGASLYVGADQPLNGHQLYMLKPRGYWRSASAVPEPDCGFNTTQGLPIDWTPPWAPNVKVDCDWITEDRKGRTPILWFPS